MIFNSTALLDAVGETQVTVDGQKVTRNVFGKATFNHGTLEKGTYTLHVGDSIFNGVLDVNQGFTQKLTSSLAGVKGTEIYLETWDVAGNQTNTPLSEAQSKLVWNLVAGTEFIV